MSGMRLAITKQELVKHVHPSTVSGLIRKRTLDLQAAGNTQLIVEESDFKSVQDLIAEIAAKETELIKQGQKLTAARQAATAAKTAKEKSDKSTTRRSSFLGKSKPTKSAEDEMVEYEEAIQTQLMNDIGALKSQRVAMQALEGVARKNGFGDDIDGLKRAYIYETIEDKRVVPDGAQINTVLGASFSDAVHYLIHELIGLNLLKVEYTKGLWRFKVISQDGHDQIFEISGDPSSTNKKQLEDVLYVALQKHHAMVRLDIEKGLLNKINVLIEELTRLRGQGLSSLQERVASRLKSSPSAAVKKSPAKPAAVDQEVIDLIAAFSAIDKGKQYTYKSVEYDDSGQMTKIICTGSQGDEHIFLLSEDNKTWAQEYAYGDDEEDAKNRATRYAYYDVSKKAGSNYIAFADKPEVLYLVTRIENTVHQTRITYSKDNQTKTYHGHDFLGGFHGDDDKRASTGPVFEDFQPSQSPSSASGKSNKRQ